MPTYFIITLGNLHKTSFKKQGVFFFVFTECFIVSLHPLKDTDYVL